MVQDISLIIRAIRLLSLTEKAKICENLPDHNFKWVTLDESQYQDSNVTITVPTGFLTDGSSGPFPDWGRAWLFHDWLYASHRFDDRPCTRQEADKILLKLIRHDNFYYASWLFCKLVQLNPFYIWTRAWKKSGEHGPQFLYDHVES
jgi:hypothetical protein